jgi:hypothetical protein
MEKNKKIGMLTRNDKMTTRNNRGVEKAHWNTKDGKLKMKILFFQAIEGIKTLKIEGIKYDVGGHWKIHWGCCGL